MPFILSEQREGDVTAAFARYREYLRTVQSTFPPSAFALASSEWYFDCRDHRCPHDGWLESITISEPSEGERHEIRAVTICVRLLAAYHDGSIELVYPRVFNYTLAGGDITGGHRDWCYDEFRLSDRGAVIHEIEWQHGHSFSRWIIEASDVQHEFTPTV